MGKQCEKELKEWAQTYQWALKVPIDKLRSFIKASQNSPLLIVGSGSSRTTAHIAAIFHQETGIMAKAVTPLEFVSSKTLIKNSSVLIVSAGGSNSDIVSAFRFASASKPKQLMAFCMSKGSPLAKLARQSRYAYSLDFASPTGEDGFFATNSLISFCTILIRAYGKHKACSQKLIPPQDIHKQIDFPIRPLLKKDTWVVLYGKWELPVAIDIEEKITSAALKHIQITDYKNFAHGRNLWLDKRGDNAGVVVLITPDEKKIAEKTLSRIPEHIPILQLTTSKNGSIGCLDLLVKSFYMIHLADKAYHNS